MIIKDVLEGWTNALIKDEEIEIIAEERLKICNECPYKKTVLKVEICSKCHCPLISKTRSKETKCPLHKWKQ